MLQPITFYYVLPLTHFKNTNDSLLDHTSSVSITTLDNRHNGEVVRVSALLSVDVRFIPQIVSYQRTLKNGIHSFPAWCSAQRDSVENKPASLLVVFLGKTLNGMPPSSCGRQVVGPSSLPVKVTQSDERHAN